jgi:hypothetical protein
MTSGVKDDRASGCQDRGLAGRQAGSPETRMPHVVRALFVVVAIVNLLPLSGVLGAARLEALYGLPMQDPGLLLLMRHRAVLFGLVGGLILVAAFVPTLRVVAALIGLGSLLSFVVLALPPGVHGAPLQRVFWVDLVASLLLAVALWAHWREASSTSAAIGR